MDAEGLNREEEIHSEMQPILPSSQPWPAYMDFRVSRESRRATKCNGFVRAVFKFCFCFLGLWSHQAWNYLPRVLFSAVCLYQVLFELAHILIGCWSDDDPQDPDFVFFRCSNNKSMTTPRKSDYETEEIFYGLLSVAAITSYLVFIGCFVAARRKTSALVSPSQSMVDIHYNTDIYLLFVVFLSIYTMSSSLAFYYRFKTDNIVLRTEVVAAGLAHWASANTCNVFAVTSSALGTLTKDAFKLIQEVRNGTLDDVIRIHEDLCTVVFSTVSAYSVWFVLHWFTYGASALVAAIYISEEILIKTPPANTVYLVFLFISVLYQFLLPCICAAKITSDCAAIYEKINCTTSADWNKDHPFKDRRNIDSFISYAKDRRCGFKVGRITFNTSLAWFSFFFGLTALMFHFF